MWGKQWINLFGLLHFLSVEVLDQEARAREAAGCSHGRGRDVVTHLFLVGR